MKYTISIAEKKEITKDVLEFSFKKPAGFKYKAGQYIGINLPVSDKRAENFKSFSLSSAPWEKHLVVTLRRGPSLFKQKIDSLKKGDTIDIEGPFGNFIIRPGDNDKRLVFLARGIGITPFISIFKNSIATKQYMTLFYETRSFGEPIYYYELLEMQKKNPYFHYLPFVPLPMQAKAFFSSPENLIFLCGSDKAVASYKALLQQAEINKKQIRVEAFEGYM